MACGAIFFFVGLFGRFAPATFHPWIVAWSDVTLTSPCFRCCCACAPRFTSYGSPCYTLNATILSSTVYWSLDNSIMLLNSRFVCLFPINSTFTPQSITNVPCWFQKFEYTDYLLAYCSFVKNGLTFIPLWFSFTSFFNEINVELRMLSSENTRTHWFYSL